MNPDVILYPLFTQALPVYQENSVCTVQLPGEKELLGIQAVCNI